jgi:hypothetical protein
MESESTHKIKTIDALPTWLLIGAGGVGAVTAVGIGLAKDLLDGGTADIASLVGAGVLLTVLAVLALASRGVGAQLLGFRVRPTTTSSKRLTTTVTTVTLLLPGIVIWSCALPALHLPLPHTLTMVFWIGYAVAAVMVLRSMRRRTTEESRRDRGRRWAPFPKRPRDHPVRP